MKRIAILGAGGMGTAAGLAVRQGRGAGSPGGPAPRLMPAIWPTGGSIDRHLPGIRIPEEILITACAGEAMRDAQLIVAAIPSSYLRSILQPCPTAFRPTSLFSAWSRESRTARSTGPARSSSRPWEIAPMAVLSGPSHAEEIARGLPASVVVAGSSIELNQTVQEYLSHEAFRVYTNPDAVGVELAGALKNILGIAAGICDGLGFGDNAKAALLTRGLGRDRPARRGSRGPPATFYGLAGVGDLITTCYSPFGRNRSVGERIGRGDARRQSSRHGQCRRGCAHHAERARAGTEASDRDADHRRALPGAVRGEDPRSAVSDLMVRLPKVEWDQ